MKNKLTANRYHDFSYGHRVVGHENKCKWLHGHNGRVHFFCYADELDGVGRVIDFSCIKEKLCNWLEDNWDHKFLMWTGDPLFPQIKVCEEMIDGECESLVALPFNPTAENLGNYLLDVIGPQQLEGTGVILSKVIFEETRKCNVTIKKQD